MRLRLILPVLNTVLVGLVLWRGQWDSIHLMRAAEYPAHVLATSLAIHRGYAVYTCGFVVLVVALWYLVGRVLDRRIFREPVPTIRGSIAIPFDIVIGLIFVWEAFDLLRGGVPKQPFGEMHWIIELYWASLIVLF